MDSVFCHANWGQSIGGVSFPLLADFHPKGAMAESYGLYLKDKGITDRATVIIDAGGVVRHASSVGPGGERDISELAALCEKIDKEYSGDVSKPASGMGLADATLYVKDNCGFSRAALLARSNLHMDNVEVVNVSEKPAALETLKQKTGKEQAPALQIGDQVLLESADIISRMVEAKVGSLT